MDQTNYSVFEKYYSVFARAQLCHGISLDQFEIILTMLDATVKSYRKNEIIFPEGSEQTHFGMILKGELLHSRINLSGERVIFERLRAGQLFGEEKLFSRHHQEWTCDTIAKTDCLILMLSTKSFFEKRFIESDLAFPVLLNLIQMISGRFEETKVLLRSLKTKTVRQRIATFLYEQYIIDKSLCIATGFSRLELSEYLNLPRPSLSRELSCMKKDGIIDYTRDNYTILDLQKLRESL